MYTFSAAVVEHLVDVTAVRATTQKSSRGEVRLPVKLVEIKPQPRQVDDDWFVILDAVKVPGMSVLTSHKVEFNLYVSTGFFFNT